MMKDIYLCKRLFYIANALFWISGWISLGTGVYLYVEHNSYSALAPPSYSGMSSAGLCVCAGCMALIMAFMGCTGISLASKWLLCLYTALMILLVFIHLGTGIMGFLHDDIARERVKSSLYSTINRTYAVENGPEASFRVTWDYMQKTLKCCGVENHEDWFYASRWPSNRFVPDSCCSETAFAINGSQKNCGKVLDETKFYSQGCHELFADWLLHHLDLVKLFAVLFSGVEIFLIVLTVRIIIYNKNNLPRQQVYRYQKETDGDDRLMVES